MCSVIIQQAENVRVPEWVTDLASFSQWAEANDFPDEGRIDFLAGEIWIDMSQEKVWSHNQVKEEFFVVLGTLARNERRGRFFPDGLRVVHPEAELSAVPDGVWIMNETLQTMRASLVKGVEGEDIRVEGSPDMVLEVISTSSVQKDRERLPRLYWKAGIREFWRVDARKEPLTFDILRQYARGYTQARKQDGWVKSALFEKSFRLTQEADDMGHPVFTLAMR